MRILELTRLRCFPMHEDGWSRVLMTTSTGRKMSTIGAARSTSTIWCAIPSFMLPFSLMAGYPRVRAPARGLKYIVHLPDREGKGSLSRCPRGIFLLRASETLFLATKLTS